MTEIYWQLQHFNDLTALQLHSIYAARQAVFIVEQNCPYQDADALDPVCHHLAGWLRDGANSELAAYLRIVPPGLKYDEPAIGRVITAQAVRGMGLGCELMRQGVEQVALLYPNQGIRISAQHYLEAFYHSFGFATVSDIYDEDGIPHIEMALTG